MRPMPTANAMIEDATALARATPIESSTNYKLEGCVVVGSVLLGPFLGVLVSDGEALDDVLDALP